jgi:hypothetical protein
LSGVLVDWRVSIMPDDGTLEAIAPVRKRAIEKLRAFIAEQGEKPTKIHLSPGDVEILAAGLGDLWPREGIFGCKIASTDAEELRFE